MTNRFIPPIFIDLYRRIRCDRDGITNKAVNSNSVFRKGCEFVGDYSTWQEAQRDSTGYDSEVMVTRVRDCLLKVKSGKAAYERDSVLFDKVEYFWPLLAGLMWVASQSNNRLNLIDFGGSLGSTYFQNRKFLESLAEVHWNVVELKKYVDCGKVYFEDEELKFYESIESCLQKQRPNLILCSGVIQYLEDPYGFIEKLFQYDFSFAIFDRTSFSVSGKDVMTLQNVAPSIYEASYPCWFLNFEKFRNKLRLKYDIISEFDSFDKVMYPSMFKGFILRSKS